MSFRLNRVIHLEFDRVRGVLEGVHLLPLQFHVGLDLVHVEDVALQQKGMVGPLPVCRDARVTAGSK